MPGNLPNFNDNPGTPPDNGGPNNNNGNPPDNEGQNNGQSTNTGSMSKEFTLTSTATTFSGVGTYSESGSTNNDNNYSDINTELSSTNTTTDDDENFDIFSNRTTNFGRYIGSSLGNILVFLIIFLY